VIFSDRTPLLVQVCGDIHGQYYDLKELFKVSLNKHKGAVPPLSPFGALSCSDLFVLLPLFMMSWQHHEYVDGIEVITDGIKFFGRASCTCLP